MRKHMRPGEHGGRRASSQRENSKAGNVMLVKVKARSESRPVPCRCSKQPRLRTEMVVNRWMVRDLRGGREGLAVLELNF
jgi:hypothetical protein